MANSGTFYGEFDPSGGALNYVDAQGNPIDASKIFGLNPNDPFAGNVQSGDWTNGGYRGADGQIFGAPQGDGQKMTDAYNAAARAAGQPDTASYTAPTGDFWSNNPLAGIGLALGPAAIGLSGVGGAAAGAGAAGGGDLAAAGIATGLDASGGLDAATLAAEGGAADGVVTTALPDIGAPTLTAAEGTAGTSFDAAAAGLPALAAGDVVGQSVAGAGANAGAGTPGAAAAAAPVTASAFDAGAALTADDALGGSAFATGADATGVGGVGGVGTEFVPATDYSAYTGATPTDVPDPLPDQTIPPTDTPTPTPGTPPPPGAPQSAVDKALGYATKYGPLALAGIGNLQASAAAKKAGAQISSVGGPQRDQANALLSQYNSGKLNAGDAAAVSQFKTDALAKSRQYFAQAGLSSSTQASAAEAQIEAQAAAMTSQMLQGYLTTAMNELNITDKNQIAGIQAELSADQSATRAASDFLGAYGSWLRNTGTGGTAAKAA